MDRRYALPVVLSASVHVALLFGFPSSPRLTKAMAEESVFVCDFFLRPDEIALVPPDVEATGPRRELPHAPVAPASVEPAPRPDLPGDFKLTVPQIDTHAINSALHSVPLDRPAVGPGHGDGNGVIPKDWLDNSPRARSQSAPSYPFEARRDGLHGEVLVEFVVDESGLVEDARTVSSTHRVFEESALRAVSKWRFEPGRRHGKIVRFRMTVPIVFTLND